MKSILKWFIVQPWFYPLYKKIYFQVINKEISKSTNPRLLSLEVTNACNANCIMCPREKMTRKIGFMDKALFYKIVDDAAVLRIPTIHLMHYGEPLLDKDLANKVRYVKERGIKTGLFTNGALLTLDRGKELIAAGLDRLWFSFDAFDKKTYEKIRRGLNFEAVLRNIEDFLALKDKLGSSCPEVRITFVASSENHKEIQAFKKKWEGRVEEIEVSMVDNYTGALAVQLPPQKQTFVKKQKDFFPCQQLWNHLVVLWDGRVALCCKDFDGGVIVGDLNKQTITEVWLGEVLRSFRAKHLMGEVKSLPLCASCSMLANSHLFAWW